MGLDQYLTGKKFYSSWNPEGRREEDGHTVDEVTIQLGYWRKHPNLHGYIVENFGPKDEDGNAVDDCKEIELDTDQIKQIIDAVEKEELPETQGFFFGQSDGSEKAEDLEIFAKAIAWLTMVKETQVPKPMFVSIHYRASW